MDDGFLSISLKDKYNTDSDNLIHDFYNIVLKYSMVYKRAVGYFSVTALSHICQGLYHLIKNNGRMELVVGAPLTLEEYDAIKDSEKECYISKLCVVALDKIIEDCADGKYQAALKLFTFMLSNGYMDLRFAIKSTGMYHEKIGVFEDGNGLKIAFSGSANETGNAISGNGNSESILVFQETDKNIYDRFGFAVEDGFNNLWSNKLPKVKVVKATSEFIDRARAISKNLTVDALCSLYEELESNRGDEKCSPCFPDVIGANPYALKEHQISAIRSWQEQDFKGIFEMATGSGKTITSLHAAVSLYKKLKGSLFFIVAVPYQSLAEQWKIEMERFGMTPIMCCYGKSSWSYDFSIMVNTLNLTASKKFCCAIVVNATLKTNSFQEVIKQIDQNRLFFVADECHHHSNERFNNYIPTCRYLIGMSATPWNDESSDGAMALKNIYGSVVAKYTIDDAMNDGILCPYEYKIVYCHMSDSEAESYKEFSHKIAVLESRKENGLSLDENALLHLYLKRTRLLGAIKSKYSNLDHLLSKLGVLKKSLFYSGEGTDSYSDEDFECDNFDVIKMTTLILAKHGYKSTRFTSDETIAERASILNAFKSGYIDSLVSKRVLDEGIDVPSCTYAFILASANSPRQYVQRRGRILRKSSGKKHAVIYDFVVAPPQGCQGDAAFTGLLSREENRIYEFERLAISKEVINV